MAHRWCRVTLNGANYWAQLYMGPHGGSLTPQGAAVNFLSGAGAGYLNEDPDHFMAAVPGASQSAAILGLATVVFAGLRRTVWPAPRE